MRTATRLKLASARQVLEFTAVHPNPSPPARGSARRLGELVEEVELLEREQWQALEAAWESLGQRGQAEAELRVGLTHLIRFCRVVALTEGLTELKWSASRQLRAPGVMIAEVVDALRRAGPHCELLERFGMPATLIGQLEEGVELYCAAEEGRKAAQSAAIEVGPRIEKAVLAAQCSVHHLDALNRVRFADDPERLAEWDAARTVAWSAQRECAPVELGAGSVAS